MTFKWFGLRDELRPNSQNQLTKPTYSCISLQAKTSFRNIDKWGISYQSSYSLNLKGASIYDYSYWLIVFGDSRSEKYNALIIRSREVFTGFSVFVSSSSDIQRCKFYSFYILKFEFP